MSFKYADDYDEKTQLLANKGNLIYHDKRTHDIINIAKDVNDTAILFSELQDLVVDQGEVIDTIESHIQNSKKDIDHGTKDLIETKEEQGNPCSTSDPKLYFIVFLLIGIGVFIIYVVVKHTRKQT